MGGDSEYSGKHLGFWFVKCRKSAAIEIAWSWTRSVPWETRMLESSDAGILLPLPTFSLGWKTFTSARATNSLSVTQFCCLSYKFRISRFYSENTKAQDGFTHSTDSTVHSLQKPQRLYNIGRFTKKFSRHFMCSSNFKGKFFWCSWDVFTDGPCVWMIPQHDILKEASFGHIFIDNHARIVISFCFSRFRWILPTSSHLNFPPKTSKTLSLAWWKLSATTIKFHQLRWASCQKPESF